mmetsp:Transcript_828/g.1791  ORF Transcript_828/g.1791 Transcript_828/m.1791 type:complete len:258 (+) Transcript_828:553-1326(+)
MSLFEASRVAHPLDTAVHVAALHAHGIRGLSADDTLDFVALLVPAALELYPYGALLRVREFRAAVAERLLAETALVCARPILALHTVRLLGLKLLLDVLEDVMVLLSMPVRVLGAVNAIVILAGRTKLQGRLDLAFNAYPATGVEPDPLMLLPPTLPVSVLPALVAIVLVALIVNRLEMFPESLPDLRVLPLLLELAPALDKQGLDSLGAHVAVELEFHPHGLYKLVFFDLVLLLSVQWYVEAAQYHRLELVFGVVG